MAITGQQEATAATATSFIDLYRRHVRRVTALAVAMTGSRHAGEELVQEAFARAYRDWRKVRTYDDPGAWVRRVTINLAHSRWRLIKRETEMVARLEAAPPHHEELSETSTELWRAVRRLPKRQAATVALHYIDDLPVASIAALLGVAEGTTKSDLHRARAALAKMIEEQQP